MSNSLQLMIICIFRLKFSQPGNRRNLCYLTLPGLVWEELQSAETTGPWGRSRFHFIAPIVADSNLNTLLMKKEVAVGTNHGTHSNCVSEKTSPI